MAKATLPALKPRRVENRFASGWCGCQINDGADGVVQWLLVDGGSGSVAASLAAQTKGGRVAGKGAPVREDQHRWGWRGRGEVVRQWLPYVADVHIGENVTLFVRK